MSLDEHISGTETWAVIFAATTGHYTPLFDPSAMFVVAGMSALLVLIGIWVTGLAITRWIQVMGGLVGFADRPDWPVTPRILLPVPFLIVSVGSFAMGALDLIFRWPTFR